MSRMQKPYPLSFTDQIAISTNAQYRPCREARAGGWSGRRCRFWLCDRESIGRGWGDCVGRNLAARAQHIQQPSRAREDGRVAKVIDRTASAVREDLSA